MNNVPASDDAHGYRIVGLDELTFDAPGAIARMYKLSPFVWRESTAFQILLRVVNDDEDPSKKVARIHHGVSNDGVHFVIGESPVIAPGPDELTSYDSGGCEDPTVAHVDGTYYVYYSGWNEHLKRGELLLATGPDIKHLTKRGIALPSSERVRNPKEATIARVADGSWRLFFEFAHEGRSKIGLATSSRVDGPWELLEPPFGAREGSWDSWHLSAGPILDANLTRPLMFYNGGTHRAHWRIGWVAFDETYTRVVARGKQPIALPHPKRRDDDTDILFAASVLELNDEAHLYYSVADQYCMRAVLHSLSRS
jgi:beta-1,2-mannobiose phosphorylase / 1,2-beta-oligomannan phosphorylase